MIKDAFHRLDDPSLLEERVWDVVMETFTVANEVHEECRDRENSHHQLDIDFSGEESVGEMEPLEMEDDSSFDPEVLDEAMKSLYAGARCTKLAATILYMNLCIVHQVSNCFVDEMLTILYFHLLLQENCFSNKFYATRALTKKLGLSYIIIHTYKRGCVLFKGEHADAVSCPKCCLPRYKDEVWKKFSVKVLRHFPIIPRLQRMFHNSNIAKMMLWHSENRSNREGGDNMV